MKKDKQKLKEAFFEGLLEIVLTLIFFGIGALIIRAFGVELDSPNIDFDLIILLGIIVPIVVFGIVCALVQWFKKTIKNKHKSRPCHPRVPSLSSSSEAKDLDGTKNLGE